MHSIPLSVDDPAWRDAYLRTLDWLERNDQDDMIGAFRLFGLLHPMPAAQEHAAYSDAGVALHSLQDKGAPLDALYRALGPIGLKARNAHLTIDAYTRLGSTEGVRHALAVYEDQRSGYLDLDLLIAYRFLGDQAAIERLARNDPAAHRMGGLEADLVAGGESFTRRLISYVETLATERDLPIRCSDPDGIVLELTALYTLAREYDVGVALTTGGIASGMIAQAYGLPVIAARTKRQGRGATFAWCDDPEQVRGARVLVLEDDAITGKTLRRVSDEILAYQPRGLDLYLANDIRRVIRSDTAAVPRAFTRIITDVPNPTDAYDAIMDLNARLGPTA